MVVWLTGFMMKANEVIRRETALKVRPLLLLSVVTLSTFTGKTRSGGQNAAGSACIQQDLFGIVYACRSCHSFAFAGTLCMVDQRIAYDSQSLLPPSLSAWSKSK
jgi:hypothetical protein